MATTSIAQNNVSTGQFTGQFQQQAQVENRLFIRLAAEAAGSFIVCFAIYLTSIWTPFAGLKVAPLNIAFFTFIAYFLAFNLLGKFSGGHFNPMVTLYKVFSSTVDFVIGVGYILAQFAGAILAAFSLFMIMPATTSWKVQKWLAFAANGFGANSPSYESLTGIKMSFDWPLALTVELFGCLIVIAAYNRISKLQSTVMAKAGIVGAAYALAVVVAQAVSNAGLNPARSLAIAIFAQDFSRKDRFDWPLAEIWVFILVPVIAAFIFGFVQAFLKREKSELGAIKPAVAKAPKPPRQSKARSLADKSSAKVAPEETATPEPLVAPVSAPSAPVVARPAPVAANVVTSPAVEANFGVGTAPEFTEPAEAAPAQMAMPEQPQPEMQTENANRKRTPEEILASFEQI